MLVKHHKGGICAYETPQGGICVYETRTQADDRLSDFFPASRTSYPIFPETLCSGECKLFLFHLLKTQKCVTNSYVIV